MLIVSNAQLVMSWQLLYKSLTVAWSLNTGINCLYGTLQEWAASIQNVCSWSINPNLAPGSDRMDPKDKMAVVTVRENFLMP